MIALLLATQLSTQFAAPPGVAPPLLPPSAKEIVRGLPGKQACMSSPGHLEVWLRATPMALYRQGDRPPSALRKWAEYPDGTLCAVEAAR